MSNIIKNHNIGYAIRKSLRAKQVRITIKHDGSVIVTVPTWANEKLAHRFVLKKSKWISSKINYFKNNNFTLPKKGTREDYLKNKKRALEIVKKKITFYNKLLDVKFNKIFIKNNKNTWGSCSRKGNLNFNYKIITLPENVSDYIIVHELAHLIEFNHSKNFWKIVSKIFPDYLEIRKSLKGLQ